MLVDAPPQKIFEKPDSGVFLGVLADLIYEDNVPTQYGPKNKITFKWILNAKDKTGNDYTVIRRVNRTMGIGSDLYKLVQEILGTAPPVPYDVDKLLGTVRNLVITRSPGIDKRTGAPTEYANIVSTFPPKPGETFAIPAGFVRAKDKPARGSAPAAQATQAAPATAAPAQSAPAPAAQAAAAVQDQGDEIPF